MKRALLCTVTLSMLLAAAGCGPTVTEKNSSSFRCCLNGRYYTCPNQETFDQCVDQPQGCDRDPSKDDTCAL